MATTPYKPNFVLVDPPWQPQKPPAWDEFSTWHPNKDKPTHIPNDHPMMERLRNDLGKVFGL